MAIQVTPIPKLTVFTAPAFTLGLVNTAGSAITAAATNSTLLAFDGTLPDAITFAQSGATGSATVASRRDHAHAMASASITDYSAKRKPASNQAVSTGTGQTTLTWGTEIWDTASYTSGSDQRYTADATTAGKHIVQVTVRWGGNTTGDRTVYIYHDQDGIIGAVAQPTNNGVNNETMQYVAALTELAEDEYVEIRVSQDSGGDLNVETTASQFSIMRLTD